MLKHFVNILAVTLLFVFAIVGFAWAGIEIGKFVGVH